MVPLEQMNNISFVDTFINQQAIRRNDQTIQSMIKYTKRCNFSENLVVYFSSKSFVRASIECVPNVPSENLSEPFVFQEFKMQFHHHFVLNKNEIKKISDYNSSMFVEFGC